MDFKLDEIVREFMVEDLGLESIDRRYSRFLSIAISGLRDLYYDNIGGVEKEVLLEVNDDETATLPSDFIDYYAIGLVYGNEFASLGLNSNMNALAKDDCGNKVARTTADSDDGGFLYSTTNYNDKSENLGRAFGVGGGRSSIGEYKIYKERGYIALSGVSASNIVLRYKADIQSIDGNYNVHPYSVEAIKAWIWKKYVSRTRSYGLGEKQLADMAYKKAKKQALQRHYSFNIYEFIQAWKTGTRSSPKF